MYRLIAALLAAASLLFCLDLSAQEIPKAAIARQAYGIDVETHIDLLIGAEEAQNHLYELVMVCGLIVDTYFEHSNTRFFDARYLAGQRNTFLYFDKPRGEHGFVAIVIESVRKFMPKKPESLKGHRACVYGKVSRYRQRVAIQVIRSEQLSTRELAENP